MTTRTITHTGALALALLLGLGAFGSHAEQNGANPNASSAPIAMVDMDRIYAASDAPQQVAQKAMEYDTENANNLQSVLAVPFLTQKELGDYITLLTRPKPTEAEQGRLKELKTTSDKRSEELQTLSSKNDADLTAADKTRMRELSEQRRLLEKILPRLQEDLRTDRDARVEAFRREQVAKLRGMVAQVAREKGLAGANIFDATVLVYAPNDLTPQVLQRLGKRSGK